MTKETTYEKEWHRQRERRDLTPRHLPAHRWYLRIDEPWLADAKPPPRDGLSIVRAEDPTVEFYRFLYHSAGEAFLWGARRRMPDDELMAKVRRPDCHIMVLYDRGTPAGYFELDFKRSQESSLKYFALLPGKLGNGLGGYMLGQAIAMAGSRKLPLIVDTCTLDHHAALENYIKRGFRIYDEEDEEAPDPRLDGTIPRDACPSVPLAK